MHRQLEYREETNCNAKHPENQTYVEQKLCSFKGKVVSQFKAPFTDANSTARCSVGSNC